MAWSKWKKFGSSCNMKAFLYSWGNHILLTDCPTTLNVSCKYTVYLFDNDTGTLIASGTAIKLTNNTAKNIKIKAVNSFYDNTANGSSAPDAIVTITFD